MLSIGDDSGTASRPVAGVKGNLVGAVAAMTAQSERLPTFPLPAQTATPRAISLAAVLGLLATCGLFTRIMSFPLRHDEQFYVPAGILFSRMSLYYDFGYNHLPNLPILLSALFSLTGTHHYLLAGRLLLFAVWLAGGAAIILIARLMTASMPIAALAVTLYVTNPVLLGPTGMAVTNNFVPVAGSLIGLYFFLLGTRAGADRRRAGCLLASGFAVAAAVGFKINYVFLLPCFGCAVLFAPTAASVHERVRLMILPFVAGALLGGLPTLIFFLSDPANLWAHVVRYHRVAQVEYWAGNDEVAVGPGQKIMLAHQLWLLGAGGCIPLGIGYLLCLIGIRRGPRATLIALANAPVLIVTGLVVLGCMVSFIPTPSFPQYYAPPIVFGIVLVVLLYGMLDRAERDQATPFVFTLTVIAAVAGGPQLCSGIGALVHPRSWTGIAVHRNAEALASETGRDHGPVATLAPLYPLEAGLPIYPELASGPFVYRVGDILHRTDASHYRRLTSPTLVGAVLARTPPSSVLVGLEGELEAPLVAFATMQNYRKMPQPVTDRAKREAILYLRTN